MKRIITVALIITLIVAGYFGYKNWEDTRSISAWSLINEDAFLVYESDNLWRIYSRLDSIKTWRSLATLPALANIKNNLTYLDSLSSTSKVSRSSITTLFENTPVLISLHITEAHDFDFLYLLEIKNLEQHSIVSALLESVPTHSKKSKRQYLGKTISEIEVNGTFFSYIFYKNYFIGSFTPFLVEGAIRTIVDDNVTTFLKNHQELFRLAKLSQDDGNLYLNYQKLARFLEVFSDRVKVDLSTLNLLSYEAFLDIKVDTDNIILNGFTLDKPTEPSLLSSFVQNPGVPFSLYNVIPNRTSYLLHFSYSNYEKWNSNWTKMWPENYQWAANQRAELIKKNDIDLSEFNSWIGNEIGLVAMESNKTSEPDYLVAIAAPDIGEATKQLNNVADRLARIARDTVYREQYSNSEIVEIKIPQLPALIFGHPFPTFESTFFVPVYGNIVLSNSAEQLKNVLDDIESENTWGKSVKTMDFISSLNKEANLTLIVNTNRSWNSFIDKLNGNWQSTLDEYATVAKSFETLAVQYSNIGNKYYTNIVFNQPFEPKGKLKTTPLTPQKSINFPNALVTKPYYIRKSQEKSAVILVQDGQNNVYQLSHDLSVQWSDSLEQPIVSDILAIDYYKNSKIQAVFALANQIRALDSSGKLVESFPINKPTDSDIMYFNLIDYDKSKNYRLAIADDDKNVWLLSKEGNKLDGWNPRSFNEQIALSPFHIRISARDVIVVALANGEIHLLNRRGELYNGFPLDLKATLNGTLHTNIGTTLEKTTFTTVTESGEIIQFNATGKIIKREQLIRTSADSRFRLIKENSKSSYLICRIDEYRVNILDSSGKPMFEKDYISGGDLKFQYFNFGGGNEVIIILDLAQQYAYLYDKKGALINSLPISASQELTVLYSEGTKEYSIYRVYDNELSLYKLKR